MSNSAIEVCVDKTGSKYTVAVVLGKLVKDRNARTNGNAKMSDALNDIAAGRVTPTAVIN
jgi:DNA-directed RNA polymerase subunit K/omega